MRETNKITDVRDVKINKSASLYHTIQEFLSIRQSETDPGNTFRLCSKNINETMELTARDNILCIKQLTKNGSQVLTKDKH